jgi:asparagine synthase (glutamine-hydrolysing)
VAMPGLDPTMFDRPKAGFVLPIDVWAKAELKPQIEATFQDRDLAQRTGIDPEAVGKPWRAYQAGAPGLYWSRVWAMFVLLWWCQRHRVSL